MVTTNRVICSVVEKYLVALPVVFIARDVFACINPEYFDTVILNH